MKLPMLSHLNCRQLSVAQPSVGIYPAGYCGTSWHEPYVRDRYGGANFSDACEAHDQCYGTCGQSKEDCDGQFERHMEAECRRTYGGGGLDYIARNTCIGLANTYSVAVERMGGDAYRAAQRASSCS